MRCARARASGWRRGRFLFSFLVLACLAIAGAAPGSEISEPVGQPIEATPVVRLSWHDIARAVDQQPRLLAGNYQVDAARGGVRAAGAVPNPTLEGTLGQGHPQTQGLEEATGSARVEWSATLTVPLGWIAQRSSRIGAASAEVDAADSERKALRRDVMLQLRTLFWNLAYEQELVGSLTDLESQTNTLAQTVAKRVEKGEARPVEATRVEIELENVRSDLDAARTALGARQAELALWLGAPADRTLEAVADLEATPTALDRETALYKARSTHPALAAAKARTRALEAEVAVERRARVPSFDVNGFAESELDRRAYGVGLSVDLPVWNWNSGRIAQAEASLAAGRKQAEAAALDLEASVLDTQAACQASSATATRFKNNVVPRSESAAATMERTYQLGEASLLELIDSRRNLLDSRRLYLSALAQAQIDCSRLGALVGEDFE
jgi:cobalt-zinc-cadmium efflux system outer membrane protein